MQTLITGGAGFIGSSLADRLLSQAGEVAILDNFNDYYNPSLKEKNVAHNVSNPNYKLYRADICDAEALERVFVQNNFDVIVHIAASAGVRASIQNPQLFVQANIAGTVNILGMMKKYNIKKMVFASSSSVYGNCEAKKFSEDLCVSQPISPYAATKLSCEQLLYTYSRLYDIQALCMRFFTVYGPRQRPDLAIRKFIELIENDKPIQMYGDGSTIRDYTFIDDIVDGVTAAIDYEQTQYEIINLGGGSPIKLLEMIASIEKILGKKAKIETLPMQQGDVDKTAADISKAAMLLNYQPKVDFESGIRQFVEWRAAIGKRHELDGQRTIKPIEKRLKAA